MNRDPFDFFKDGPVAFFDEGSWEPGDLLTREYDEGLAFGVLKEMVEDARSALEGVRAEGVRAILQLADAMLHAGAFAGLLRDEHGEPVAWTSETALRVSHLALLPFVLESLSRDSFLLGDAELGIEAFEVTPARFCAAYLLRATFSALDFGYDRGIDDLPICYLMQASAVYGYLSVLRNGEADSVRQIVIQGAKSESARTSASLRWSKDPSRDMWSAVFTEWSKWRDDRSSMPKPADFRRAMQLRFPDLVDGTLKNKMSLWERQFRNDAGRVSR